MKSSLIQIRRRMKTMVGSLETGAFHILYGTSLDKDCIDCLQTFRNSYYHPQLRRSLACERFEDWGRRLNLDHEIPPLQPEPVPD